MCVHVKKENHLQRDHVCVLCAYYLLDVCFIVLETFALKSLHRKVMANDMACCNVNDTQQGDIPSSPPASSTSNDDLLVNISLFCLFTLSSISCIVIQ